MRALSQLALLTQDLEDLDFELEYTWNQLVSEDRFLQSHWLQSYTEPVNKQIADAYQYDLAYFHKAGADYAKTLQKINALLAAL